MKCVSVSGYLRVSVRENAYQCPKFAYQCPRTAYQCPHFSLVEVFAPITPYTPKGYGVVAHAPWGGGQPWYKTRLARSGGQGVLLTTFSREEVEETDDGLRIMLSAGWGASYRDLR